MEKEKTADEIYLMLKDVLQEVNAPDKYVYRAIDKICDKQHGIGISAKGVRTIKEDYLKFKKKRNIDAFLKRVFEIANDEGIYSEQYEDIKFVAGLREKIRGNSVKPKPKKEDAKPSDAKTEVDEAAQEEEQKAKADEIKQKQWQSLLDKYRTPGERQEIERQERLKQEKEKQQQQKETTKNDNPVKRVVANIKSTDLQTDNQKYQVIKYLGLNGLTLDELSIDGIPVEIIESGEGSLKILAILNVLKARMRTLFKMSTETDKFEESVSTVLGWVLGEKLNAKREIRYKESRVVSVNSNAPNRFIRIVRDCFSNENNDTESAVMVFILERLKRKRLDLTRNNALYDSYKNRTQTEYERLVKEAMQEKGRSFLD